MSAEKNRFTRRAILRKTRDATDNRVTSPHRCGLSGTLEFWLKIIGLGGLVMADSTTNGTNGFRVIGTRPIRHDGVDKVTGRAKYGADYAFPVMLHGKVLRSPHAHARIKSINCEKARKLPDVFSIITGADFPECKIDAAPIAGEHMINVRHISYNVMARDKDLYAGHALAAVAASSPHITGRGPPLLSVG